MKLLKVMLVSGLLMGSTAFAQVNINTASAQELSALMGIGPKKAAAIIKYRKANGKFKSVSDLTNVNGVGELTVKNLGSDIKTTGTTNINRLKNKKKAPAKKTNKTTKKSTKKTPETKKSKSTTKPSTSKKKTTKSSTKQTKAKNKTKSSVKEKTSKTKKPKTKKKSTTKKKTTTKS